MSLLFQTLPIEMLSHDSRIDSISEKTTIKH